MISLSADLVLSAYVNGVFPMSDARDDPDIFWVDPDMRGIFPLDKFHVSRSLAKTIRKKPFEVTIDQDFRTVMRECAASSEGRDNTWINETILDLYGELHDRGHAHSIECRQDGKLVGGLYGVSFASVFCGESMFSRVKDASKVALVHLVARLIHGGYTLLDTQFLTPHLASLGAIEVSREAYHTLLDEGLKAQGDFYSLSLGGTGTEILQSITQTS